MRFGSKEDSQGGLRVSSSSDESYEDWLKRWQFAVPELSETVWFERWLRSSNMGEATQSQTYPPCTKSWLFPTGCNADLIGEISSQGGKVDGIIVREALMVSFLSRQLIKFATIWRRTHLIVQSHAKVVSFRTASIIAGLRRLASV